MPSLSIQTVLIFHPETKLLTIDADWSKKPIVSQVLESQANKGVKEYESKDEKEWIYSFSKSQLLGMIIPKVSKNRAFLASRILVTKTILLGALVLCLCLIFSLLFTQDSPHQLCNCQTPHSRSSRETTKCKSLSLVGTRLVSSESLSINVWRDYASIKGNTENARFEKELETAQAVQGTLF